MASSTAATASTGRFLDPATLGKISSLQLLAKTVVEGFISGLHRSPFLGRTMDFAEYRAYLPGDDIRKIDWKLYSRTDRFYVKEYEGDTNTNVSFLLDVSKSMDYSFGGRLSKFDYGRYLAACLAYFAHRQKDRVGLVLFDNDIVEYVPPAAKHMQTSLLVLDRARPCGEGSLLPPMLKVADLSRRRSLTVLISDLYEEPSQVLQAVRGLVARGNDLIIFHLLDRSEIDFPFDVATDFVDLESGERIPIVPESLRERYRELIEAHSSELKKKLGEHRIDYTLVDTATPLDHVLYSYLSRRLWAMKTR